jgi:phosphoglycerate dehydrogenase-like enzyme
MRMPDRPLVISAPHPRTLELIFAPDALATLRGRYRVTETDPDAVATLPAETLGAARYVLGQPPLTGEAIDRMTSLRAILNVEGNLLPNMPYAPLFARGIHVLTTAAVFAQPVAELGLALALDLARGVTEADLAFREGREAWGLEGNARARLLAGSDIGLVGFGELGRALHRLLAPFRARVRAHDPWLPDAVLAEAGVEPAALDTVLATSDFVFVVAAVTTENRGFLDAAAFARMRPGAAFILLSRADVVDFDALLAAVRSGRITAASDVFPAEPMPPDHPVRRLPGFLRSAHRAGALDAAFKRMGDMLLDDMALMDRGLPPVRCKRAERETVARLRSRPVDRS